MLRPTLQHSPRPRCCCMGSFFGSFSMDPHGTMQRISSATQTSLPLNEQQLHSVCPTSSTLPFFDVHVSFGHRVPCRQWNRSSRSILSDNPFLCHHCPRSTPSSCCRFASLLSRSLHFSSASDNHSNTSETISTVCAGSKAESSSSSAVQSLIHYDEDHSSSYDSSLSQQQESPATRQCFHSLRTARSNTLLLASSASRTMHHIPPDGSLPVRPENECPLSPSSASSSSSSSSSPVPLSSIPQSSVGSTPPVPPPVPFIGESEISEFIKRISRDDKLIKVAVHKGMSPKQKKRWIQALIQQLELDLIDGTSTTSTSPVPSTTPSSVLSPTPSSTTVVADEHKPSSSVSAATAACPLEYSSGSAAQQATVPLSPLDAVSPTDRTSTSTRASASLATAAAGTDEVSNPPASSIPVDHKEKADQVFRILDVNQDGFVGLREFRIWFSTYYLNRGLEWSGRSPKTTMIGDILKRLSADSEPLHTDMKTESTPDHQSTFSSAVNLDAPVASTGSAVSQREEELVELPRASSGAPTNEGAPSGSVVHNAESGFGTQALNNTSAKFRERIDASPTSAGALEDSSLVESLVPTIPRQQQLDVADEENEEEEDEDVEWTTLGHVVLRSSIPYVAFGVIDNGLMLTCGEWIDQTVAVRFCLSTMAAAGLGNTLSCATGVVTGGFIERICLKSRIVSQLSPVLTAKQSLSHGVRSAHIAGSVLGIVTGCLIGMFPLLFTHKSSTSVDPGSPSADDSHSGTCDAVVSSQAKPHLDMMLQRQR